MSRHPSSLLLDFALLGTAALVASVSVSLAVEPLIAGDVESPAHFADRETSDEDIASFDGETRDKLSQLTALPLTTKVVVTHTPAPSPLRYLIAGTVVGRYSATAILVDPNARATLLVRVGDLIDDGVVTAISRGRVVLLRDGREEVIDSRALASQSSNSSPLATIRTLAPDRVAVPRSIIESSLASIHSLASQAFFTPSFVDGRAAFRIDRIRTGSVFEQLGIQNADVIVAVDGIPLSDFGALAEKARGLAQTRSVEVTFMRGGQLQRRTYEING